MLEFWCAEVGPAALCASVSEVGLLAGPHLSQQGAFVEEEESQESSRVELGCSTWGLGSVFTSSRRCVITLATESSSAASEALRADRDFIQVAHKPGVQPEQPSLIMKLLFHRPQDRLWG